MVLHWQQVSPKVYTIPPWVASFLSRTRQFRSGFEPKMLCGLETEIQSELQYCIDLHGDKLSCPRLSGLFDAIGICAVEEIAGTCEDKFIAVDFDFATLLSSPFCSCILFVIVSRQLIKLEFLAQQLELKWLMLNKRRILFHSSRLK